MENESRIQDKVEQLLACAGNYAALHQAMDRKRQAWWEAHQDDLALSGSLPRQAYTMLLLRYMRLDPQDVPLVYEDERKVTWRSYNFCPLLEACKHLGLDTRIVCREGAEPSVQNLIARLDPRLRFSRNYTNGMRPYAEYCEETIELVD